MNRGVVELDFILSLSPRFLEPVRLSGNYFQYCGALFALIVRSTCQYDRGLMRFTDSTNCFSKIGLIFFSFRFFKQKIEKRLEVA